MLGMTKGTAALPWRAVAGQKAFFITLGGPNAHDYSGRETILFEIEDFLRRLPICNKVVIPPEIGNSHQG